MTEWIQWGIQIVAYGLICFLLKRELGQMDQRHQDLSERIDAVEKESKTANHEMEEKLDHFIAELPFKYTLRDDFIRTVASMENKLDKILDQLNRNSGS